MSNVSHLFALNAQEQDNVHFHQQAEWERISPEQKIIQLYLEQKKTLEAFLERGAISKAQFDKSLGDLTVKMGMTGLAE
jgi:ribosomal protein S4